ncbi:MAG TPA: hypothetical protein PKN44_08535 [Bacteroidales bacterium]|nr:hypothetical protein [Bacteroidales bacterium]HPS49851.1 hypothetical protein [Bacteroidales bacterium]
MSRTNKPDDLFPDHTGVTGIDFRRLKYNPAALGMTGFGIEKPDAAGL